MNRTARIGRMRGGLYGCLFLLACAVWVVDAQQAPGGNFTGGDVETLTPEGRLSYYIFQPGARTRWHSHGGGQMILVEEGVGRTQTRGSAPVDLQVGDTVWAPQGVAHWHGSSPGQSAKLFQVSRGVTSWMEAVTDADYNAAPAQ